MCEGRLLAFQSGWDVPQQKEGESAAFLGHYIPRDARWQLPWTEMVPQIPSGHHRTWSLVLQPCWVLWAPPGGAHKEPGDSFCHYDPEVLRSHEDGSLGYLRKEEEGTLPGQGLFKALIETQQDPVPGGCNNGSNISDPNIYVSYNLFETTISFEPASTGYARGQTTSPCSTLGRQFQYEVYQYLLPENNLSEEVLIYHLQRVVIEQGTANGKPIKSLNANEETRVSFNSVPGQGVIFLVIVKDNVLNTSSLYLPAHTYACDFASIVDNCYTLGKISTKVFFIFIGIAGLFICFFGHRYFKCARLGLTAMTGIISGALVALCWWRFGSVIMCMAMVSIILGLILASIIFFTRLGDFNIFQSDIIFWVLFCVIALIVPLLFIWWPREGNIIACGVVGAYAVVLAVHTFASTTFAYITFNTLKRALNDDFSRSFTNVHFQDIDIVMLVVWVCLAGSGIAVQYCRERTNPLFPPNPYMIWKQEQERRKTNILDPSYHIPPLRVRLKNKLEDLFKREEPTGERTPLLL
ncbi:TM7S3 protein, partial [Polypterus senegalus]